MTENSLKSGDRVIELAGMAQSVAVLSGAIAAVTISWISKRSWIISGISLLVGSMIGIAIGHIAARVFYFTSDGMTTVVRPGASSLPATVRASLIGAIPTTLLISFLGVLFMSASTRIVFPVSLACGFGIGLIFACLGSLL